MNKNNIDVFDKYYLISQIEEKILELYDKKRGVRTDYKMEIQMDIWKKLLNIVKELDCNKETHKFVFEVKSIGEVSDGSHTFDELYYHRMILFSVICNSHKDIAWKSWFHHDNTMYEDYFIVGINTPEGQFSYHYHKDWWDKFEVPQLVKAPEFDGHTSDDIVRLLSIIEKDEE